jgi:hypothetical protein
MLKTYSMIDVDHVLQLQQNNIVNWHHKMVLTQTELPWKFIEENNQYNFLLWHEEDIARIKDIDPLRMVDAKRNIDKYNQLRNNAIEKVDEWILTCLAIGNDPNLPMHSETPGMMMDRLSIMALKRYHMFEETTRLDASEEHITKCANKVSVLDEQINDLADCLNNVLQLLSEGKLKFKVYRQFKMYNDPELNPQLYKRQQLKIVK